MIDSKPDNGVRMLSADEMEQTAGGISLSDLVKRKPVYVQVILGGGEALIPVRYDLAFRPILS